jgi:hypothetical protein
LLFAIKVHFIELKIEEACMKGNKYSTPAGYLIAGVLGALAGGISVLVATRAIPKTIDKLMDSMMTNMFAKIAESGCSPSDM